MQPRVRGEGQGGHAPLPSLLKLVAKKMVAIHRALCFPPPPHLTILDPMLL